MSIDYSEKKNKTPDNLKAENHNCMGFRNFTLKPFKIDPSKLKGFSSWCRAIGGMAERSFHLLNNGGLQHLLEETWLQVGAFQKNKETTGQSFVFN